MRQQLRFGDPMANALSKSKAAAGASTLTERYNAEALNKSGEAQGWACWGQPDTSSARALVVCVVCLPRMLLRE